jgi:hypothetical protein
VVPQVSSWQATFKWCHCQVISFPSGSSQSVANKFVGILDRQTYQGVPEVVDYAVEDCDRETENSKVCARTRETRFIQVRVAKVANPTSCLEIKYGALRLMLGWFRCPARYLALLYIVQGAGS